VTCAQIEFVFFPLLVGIEEDASAVADARLNATELTNAEFIPLSNPDRTQAGQPRLIVLPHPFPYAKIRFFEPQNQGFPY
jgi:hypothetical protein